MRKIWHLGTCSTCQRILRDHSALQKLEMADLRTHMPKPSEIEHIAALAGSYESIFNKRAQLLQQMPNRKNLTEKDYQHLILTHYTFVKRPLIVIDDQVFAGNAEATIRAAVNALA
jgi:arsenate reductase-like glutaredoxin family protein